MDKSVKKKKRSENQRRLFFQSRHTDGQEAHEKILNITNYWRNASTNYNEISSGTNQKGHYDQVYK